MIKLQVIGHLGKDATVKEVNGRKVINFSVAHTEKYTDKQGNKVEKTTWVECGKWVDANGSTKVSEYLTKGTLVYVEGTPDVNAYSNRQGEASASLRLSVFNLQLLGGKKDGAAAPAGQAAPAAQAAAAGSNGGGYTPVAGTGADDDLPF